MQREIKFKRYHFNYSGELITISYWGFGIEEGYGFTSPAWVTDEDRSKAKDCQYTGLKDKNGKEIYEGDIVNCISIGDFPNNDTISDIIFSQDYSWAVRTRVDGIDFEVTHGLPINWGGWESLEVVGNIYENPNLTK